MTTLLILNSVYEAVTSHDGHSIKASKHLGLLLYAIIIG